MNQYMPLTEQQIEQLEKQSCRCDDWTLVKVSEQFEPKFVRNVNFSGDIRIGSFRKVFTLAGGIRKHSGIYHATLHNVEVGDDCMIENIRNYIANYHIGEGSYIENVTDLITYGDTSFGNGTCVNVLNESGGREVYIHDNLTAHEAYITCLYRHMPQLTLALKSMVDKYVASVSTPYGTVGRNVEIIDAMHVVNVRIGDATRIKGISRLRNGSIISNPEAPVFIGMNVIADDFIVESGSSIEDGVIITRCFVGQGCRLGHAYSASDSLFFSNCQGENGEACALFAGPYTVTHHKSTLLIAGMFSFMNAGSGSNQSNHMYKLGPIHQGIMDRGARMASDSYILWPAKIGAFSLVMGRHTSNVDTTNLPFSYLIEQQGTTYIFPGVNIKSVGTIRDVKKWPKRDNRKGPGILDSINFNLLSPYTMQKMLNGLEILRRLSDASGSRADSYSYRGALIRNASLFKGIGYYEASLSKFLGNSLISRIENADVTTDEKLRAALKTTRKEGSGAWVDISGLLTPASVVDLICEDIASGKITDIRELSAIFAQIHSEYYEYEWTWAREHICTFFGVDMDSLTRAQAAEIVVKWKEAVLKIDRMVYDDAKKEFSLSSMTGFGADGDKVRRDEDFAAVRGGDFDQNPFVMEVKNHIERKSALAELILEKLSVS